MQTQMRVCVGKLSPGDRGWGCRGTPGMAQGGETCCSSQPPSPRTTQKGDVGSMNPSPPALLRAFINFTQPLQLILGKPNPKSAGRGRKSLKAAAPGAVRGSRASRAAPGIHPHLPAFIPISRHTSPSPGTGGKRREPARHRLPPHPPQAGQGLAGRGSGLLLKKGERGPCGAKTKRELAPPNPGGCPGSILPKTSPSQQRC